MKTAKRRHRSANEAHQRTTQMIPCVVAEDTRPCWKRRFSIAALGAFAVLLSVTIGAFPSAKSEADEKAREPFDIVLSGTEGDETVFEDDVPQPGQNAYQTFVVTVEGEDEKEEDATGGKEQALKAQEYLDKGNIKGAIPFIKRAIDLAPQNALYRLQLAILHDRLSENEKALNLYRQVIEAYDEDERTLPSGTDVEGIRERMAYLAGP